MVKLNVDRIVERAISEAIERNREKLAAAIDALANESGVIVGGVRHVSAARLLALIGTAKSDPS